MLGLSRHLETKAAMDPKQGAEWPTTAAGKEFAGRSSEEWCRASIADGTPEQEAHEAAGRVTAFYTGQG